MSEKTPQGDDGMREDALRDLLRAGDPAADIEHTGLDPIQRAHLRQRVTAAAQQHASAKPWTSAWRPGWLVPAVAVTVLVSAVGLALWSSQNGPSGSNDVLVDDGPQDLPPLTASDEPTPGPGDDAPGEAPILEASSATVADVGEVPTGGGVVHYDAAAPDVAADPGADVDVPSSDIDRQPRTVQFTAPRGTRIIWTLDPNYESPIAGQEPGQEETP